MYNLDLGSLSITDSQVRNTCTYIGLHMIQLYIHTTSYLVTLVSNRHVRIRCTHSHNHSLTCVRYEMSCDICSKSYSKLSTDLIRYDSVDERNNK